MRETTAADVLTIVKDCEIIMNIANGPHENAEELMTHKELMTTRSDNVIKQKSAKLNAGLEVLNFAQKRGTSSLVQSEYDVIEVGDSDNSENVDKNKDEDASDDDSTTNRHGNEPKVRIGAKDFVRAQCGAVAVPRKKAKKSRCIFTPL